MINLNPPTLGATNATPLSQKEAERFVKELLEEVFPNGKSEALAQFYHPDVVGHYQQGTFGFADIQERMKALHEHACGINFTVEWCRVIGDLIVFTCHQYWVNRVTRRFYDTLLFGVYRLRDGRIAELWLELDSETPAYQEVSRQFTEATRPFEVQQKNKRDFLRKLERLPLKVGGAPVVLNKHEQESLFYYFSGFSAKEAARVMMISPRTFEGYIKQAKLALGCRTKGELRKVLRL